MGAGGSLLFLPLNQKVYEYFGMPAVGILKKKTGLEETSGERTGMSVVDSQPPRTLPYTPTPPSAPHQLIPAP